VLIAISYPNLPLDMSYMRDLCTSSVVVSLRSLSQQSKEGFLEVGSCLRHALRSKFRCMHVTAPAVAAV
jgi:hypothetical protein